MSPQQNILKNLKLNKICRTCLGEYGEMRPLYGSCLDDMLRSVAQVEVRAGDGLPESMCLQCVLQVSRAFRFKQQCERCDHTLRNCLAEEVQEQYLTLNIPVPEQKESSPQPVNQGEKCLLIFEDLQGNQQEFITTNGQDSVIVNNIERNHVNGTLGIVLADESVKVTTFPVQQDEIEEVSEILLTEDAPVGTQYFHPLPVEDDISVMEEKEEKDEDNLNPSTSFQCHVCNKAFPKRRMWRRHLKIHDPVKPHVCNECGMSFTESSNLKKHMKKHTGELRNVVGKPNLCSVCGKGFKWASSLSKHMNHHTKKKILNCPHCPKYYVESRSLRIHLRTHTGEKPYVCDVCDKGFTQMCNLEKHLRVHTGEKPFLCPICGKGFSQSGYVAVHLRSHTGEKPYICSECGKTFAGSNSLAIHRKIHTGEKPFVCEICKRAFARQESLAIHLRTHTGEKSHLCSVCNRGFTCSSHLTIHMRTHTGEKPYVCKICPRKFISCNSLKAHCKTHEKDKQHEIILNEIKADIIQCNEKEREPQGTIMILQEELEERGGNQKSFSILALNQ